jgi:hypothetical protein
MRVSAESFTVIPDPMRGEISLLIAGLNIVLDLDEARELARQLLSGMQRLGWAPDRSTRPPDRAAQAASAASPAAPTASAPPAPPAEREARTTVAAPASGAAEEPSVRSTASALANAPADPPQADRQRKRLRSFLKVLAKDDLRDDGDIAAGGR